MNLWEMVEQKGIQLNLDLNRDQLNLRSLEMHHLAQESSWHQVERCTIAGTPVGSSALGCPLCSRGLEAWAAVHLTVDCYHADPRCPRLRQAAYRRRACAECGGLHLE